MGVYKRPDSKCWWVHLEKTGVREPTDVPIGTTPMQRRTSRALAEAIYHQRAIDAVKQIERLAARPVIRFDRYAATYTTDVLDLLRGKDRERELVQTLRAFFDDWLLTQIDRDAVRTYHAARRHAGVTASTVNREVDTLKRMLRDAVPKYLERSPLAEMPKFQTVPFVSRLLSYEEEPRLLAACQDAQDTALLTLGIDLMVRLGDLIDLERRDRCDAEGQPRAEGGFVIVRHSKTGAAYVACLTARCVTALDAIPADGPTARFYFAKFRRANNPRDWRGSVRQRLEYLCKTATPPIPFGRKHGGITFHSATRATGATRYNVHDKVPAKIVMAQGGWKRPETMQRYYVHVTGADLARVFAPTKKEQAG